MEGRLREVETRVREVGREVERDRKGGVEGVVNMWDLYLNYFFRLFCIFSPHYVGDNFLYFF